MSALRITAFVFISLVANAASQIPQVTPDPRFKEFSQRVDEYVKLRKTAESELAPLKKKTEDPHKLDERREALVKKLRRLRKGAKQGDMFTPAASEVFVQVIKMEFAGPEGPQAEKTIRAGDALKGFQVHVNQIYPEALPFTTVPPTLLLKLPQLPEDIGYRILGTDLLLVDSKSRLIIDYIENALPALRS
jgi:hypothetical protein